MMRVARRNKLFAVLIAALRPVSLLCATGTLMQTFLNDLGFAENWIYMHSTLIQAVSVLTILVSARWADKGNVIRRAALTQLPTGLLFLCYLPLCIWHSASIGSYILLLAVGTVQTLTIGLYTVCDYKIPYYVYTEKDFGAVLSWSGIVSALATFGVGALITALSSVMPYARLMFYSFLVALALMLVSAALQWNMHNITGENTDVQTDSPEQPKLPLKEVLLAPVFRDLIAANLMRGFSAGAITVLPVMALTLGYGQMVTTMMVSVNSVSMLVGCAVFGLLSGRVQPRNITLVGSLFVMAMLLMLIPGQWLFLAAYALVGFGKILVDNAVPSALLRVVPARIAGPYNAWRMILHTTGTLVGTAAAAVIPVNAMLVLTALLQLISGWMYQHTRAMYRKRT